jgi:glyoxylase-like metal-dependent hydrolase (beta-lactamase superfamily II)
MENTFHRFRAGEFNCTVISDGWLMIPPPPGSSGQEQGQKTDISCLFIDTGKHKVLIDTGFGLEAQTTAGKLLENMRAAGIKPAEIDRIIFTHGHMDHVGGTFDKQGRANFPNARYIISKDEWGCLENRPEASHLTQLFSTARQRFLTIPGQFERAENNSEVLPGIKLTAAPGHSPGNALLEITSGAQKLLCIGDIIHINFEFQRPDYLAWLDVAPDQALIVRNAIFEQAVKSKRLIFACHFDYPGLGYIVKKGAGFGWQPVVVKS